MLCRLTASAKVNQSQNLCATLLERLINHCQQWINNCHDLFSLVCRWCPRGPTCRVSAPQTEGDTEAATQEAEGVVTALHATRTALEEGSGIRQPGHNIRLLTRTTEAHQLERDSGDTWNTMNNLNVTHVFCWSLRRQRSWAQELVDSTTLNSVSSSHTTVGE